MRLLQNDPLLAPSRLAFQSSALVMHWEVFATHGALKSADDMSDSLLFGSARRRLLRTCGTRPGARLSPSSSSHSREHSLRLKRATWYLGSLPCSLSVSSHKLYYFLTIISTRRCITSHLSRSSMGIATDQYESLTRGSNSSDDIYESSSQDQGSHQYRDTNWANKTRFNVISRTIASYRITLICVAFLINNGLWLVLSGHNILARTEIGYIPDCMHIHFSLRSFKILNMVD
jgi:hypothetical protein